MRRNSGCLGFRLTQNKYDPKLIKAYMGIINNSRTISVEVFDIDQVDCEGIAHIFVPLARKGRR